MKEKVVVALMVAAALVSSTSTSALAIGQDETVNLETQQKEFKGLKKASWQYKGLTISVYGDHPISNADKKRFEKMTDDQGFTGSLYQPVSGAMQSSTPQSIIDPGDGSGFTLFSNQNKTFDNSFTYNAIYGAVGYIFSVIAVPASYGWQLSTAAGVGGISNSVFNWLGINTYVYTNVRLGTAYSSYKGYYEYIQSQTRFAYANYTSPTTVEYYQTGTPVPADTLASYGLRNP